MSPHVPWILAASPFHVPSPFHVRGFQRARSEGENPVYYVLGQTAAGRYLFCVVIRFPDGNGYPVTAREMTASEKRRYRKGKDR